MAQNIQELTSIIYQEGIQKGEAEAEKIIEEATEESHRIIENAKTKAKTVIDAARKEAENLRATKESEIKLAGLKAIREIRQRITSLITAKAIDQPLSAALGVEKIQEYIKIVLENWHTSNENHDLELLLPQKAREELNDAFIAEITKILNGKVELSFSNNLKGGFLIGPQNGGYKISLSEENFNEFFKQYLSIQTKEFLFSG